jgi:hypothetical protein
MPECPSAAAVLGAHVVRDLSRRPPELRRVKEYAFLVGAAAVASLYGVVHDEAMVGMSADYFLFGKGLLADPRPLRVAVVWLAVRSSAWVGGLAGAALLMANNPRAGDPPALTYRRLVAVAMRAAMLVPIVAAVGAVVGWIDPFGSREAAEAIVGAESARAFAIVWATQGGAYAGAVLAAGWAVWSVRRSRAKSR